jgi:hypothetical protein
VEGDAKDSRTRRTPILVINSVTFYYLNTFKVLKVVKTLQIGYVGESGHNSVQSDVGFKALITEARASYSGI